jgi:hypothetical protein
VDHVDGRVGKQVAVVPVGRGHVQRSGLLARPLETRARDGDHLRAWDAPNGIDMRSTDEANSDDPNA